MVLMAVLARLEFGISVVRPTLPAHFGFTFAVRAMALGAMFGPVFFGIRRG